MRKMRILQAITGLGIGGAERIVLDLARHLAPSKFECRIASFTDDVQSFSVFGTPTVPHHLIDIKGNGLPAVWRLRDYIELLREFKPDVVHAHMFHALMLTLLAAPFVAILPAVVFTSHSASLATNRQVVVRATRARRQADVVFFEGQHNQLNAQRTLVIPNGVPVDAAARLRSVRKSSTPVRFIYVGRLAKPKDPLGLVHAFANANIAQSRLDIVGGGPLEQDVRAAVRLLDLEDRVSLLGVRQDVRELLRTADAFVMHSQREGLPLAVLEAGAEGLPVVSTPVGAIPELLGRDAGYVASSTEFPAALRHVAASPDEALERGRRLFDRISTRYSTASLVAAHENLYGSLANKSV